MLWITIGFMATTLDTLRKMKITPCSKIDYFIWSQVNDKIEIL